MSLLFYCTESSGYFVIELQLGEFELEFMFT